MARLGFCGLGQMGLPMATRLLDAGHEITVWNRTPEKAEPLQDRGAKVAATPADAAKRSEAVITMLSTPEVVEEVVFGPNGVAEGLAPGSVLIEMSTIGQDAARRIARRLPEGTELLEAPVRGSIPAATDGSLRILAGGSEEAYARWRTVLEAMGIPAHVGPLGVGSGMKLVNNAATLSVTSLLGELLALTDRLGLDQERVLEMLETTPLGSAVPYARSKLADDSFLPHFKLWLARKDVALATEAASEAGLELKIAAAVGAWLAEAEEAGLGELDHGAVIPFVRGIPVQAAT
jgi:3-hydroxyisobutyrate dehydrogenase-like beta-hydroxyacid dehydrogenase